MKEKKYAGILSIREFNGLYHTTLDMPRNKDDAEMYFIIDWLLKSWQGKNVEITIREVEKRNLQKDILSDTDKDLQVQKDWAARFRKMGVV